MASVYEYLDYRRFLADDHARRKRRNRAFSVRAMAAKLGLDSGLITRILAGERGISRANLPKFVTYLGLRRQEAKYFETLVAFNQARSDADKAAHYARLTSLRKTQRRKLKPDQYELFAEWYYGVVRELLGYWDCREDYAELGRQLVPQIGRREAQQAVSVLLKLGVLKREADGRLVPVNRQLSTGDRWKSVLVHSFQQTTAQMGREALERFPKEERDISTLTLGLSKRGLARAREVLQRARSELLQIDRDDAGKDRVYHLNLQLFPTTRPYQRSSE
jgi:uncharacterized protein (TIGR02147 family)